MSTPNPVVSSAHTDALAIRDGCVASGASCSAGSRHFVAFGAAPLLIACCCTRFQLNAAVLPVEGARRVPG